MTSNYIGKQIGNYRIVAEIASGGFGSVYQGQHIIFADRPVVAIKLLHSCYLGSAQESESFIQEARLLEKLKHPYNLSVLDAGIHEGLPYLVAEYATNGSLRALLKRRSPRPLPIEGMLAVLSQIGQALQYAHELNIVHRDLKPENILFNGRGDALLADFGIATILKTSSIRQVDSSGTPAYMAPEQFRGMISKESDQYALGCIAYELVTGRQPFSAPDLVAMGFLHATEAPILPRQLNPALPVHMEQAILKAIAKQRTDRHTDVTTFIRALQPYTVSETNIPTVLSAQAPTVISTQLPTTLTSPASPALHNDQWRNLTPPSGSFEQLWREALQAQARGEREQAFRLLRKTMTMQGLAPSQIEAVKKQILSLRQMIPLCLQQAREAVYQGRWRDEIQAWEDLLVLESSVQEVNAQLTLHPKGSMEGDIQERLRIARQNEQCAWMYTEAQRFIREQDYTAARIQLEMLWNDAPTFGDPAGLAQVVGLSPASNYEQALVQEQAHQQKALAEEQARQQREIEQAERERQRKERQKAERQEKQQKRERISSLVTGEVTGAVVGAAMGALLTLVATSGVAETALAFPVASALAKFLSAVTLWAGLTEVAWGAILGAVVGLGGGVVARLGGVRFEHTIAKEVGGSEDYGGVFMTGLIIGVVAGAVTGALAGASYGEGVWGIALAIIGLLVGGWIGMYVGLMIGGIIMSIIEKIWGNPS